VIDIYQRRWAVEILFKELSLLQNVLGLSGKNGREQPIWRLR
jgi:IS4 transposase